MKKIIFILSIALASLSSYAQEGENIELLKRKIDSLEHRLDEKNYTRVPNGELEKELNAKVRDEVNGWFSSNFLVGGGFLAALVTVILTFGRRLITKELNDKLKKNVDEEANILKYRFDEHRNGMKEDFKELKETIGNKLTDTQNDMRKYREESIELFEKYKAETAESFQGFVNEKFTETESKITDVQAELNETVAPLFNQSVDAILQKATSGNTKNDKDEDLVKFLEKLFKKGKLPSEKSASEAIDAIIRYYFYQLNTDKMKQLINDYGDTYNLTNTTYANAGIAFLDKYESDFRQDYHDSCIHYCDEAIKKSFDYGIPYAVKLCAYSIDIKRGLTDMEKQAATDEIKKIFNQVRYTKSSYIAKELVERLDQSRTSFLKDYIEDLDKLFPAEMKELKDRVEPPPAPETATA